jgi:hypothetical protein
VVTLLPFVSGAFHFDSPENLLKERSAQYGNSRCPPSPIGVLDPFGNEKGRQRPDSPDDMRHRADGGVRVAEG